MVDSVCGPWGCCLSGVDWNVGALGVRFFRSIIENGKNARLEDAILAGGYGVEVFMEFGGVPPRRLEFRNESGLGLEGACGISQLLVESLKYHVVPSGLGRVGEANKRVAVGRAIVNTGLHGIPHSPEQIGGLPLGGGLFDVVGNGGSTRLTVVH